MGIDTALTKQAFHAKGTRLIRYDGHNELAQIGILEQFGQDPHKGHGRGDITCTCSLVELLKHFIIGQFKLLFQTTPLR